MFDNSDHGLSGNRVEKTRIAVWRAITVILVTTMALVRPSSGVMGDCNRNGLLDACDLGCGPPAGPCDAPGCGNSLDCNENGVPDECDLVAGSSFDLHSGGFLIPEDILPTIAPFPRGYIVPDVGLGMVSIVPTWGGSFEVLSEGLWGPIGATFVPDEFGGLGNRLFVTLRDDPARAVVEVHPSGATNAFVSMSMGGASGIAYAPLSVGGAAAGTLLVTDQVDVYGEPFGALHSVNADGALITLIPSFGAALFTPALAPSGFGAFANHLFVSDAMGSRLFAIDLQSLSVQVFDDLPLIAGQTGLRQLAFSPQGWAGAIDATLADASVLLVSVAGSIDGLGGVNGAVFLLDADANIVASMTTDSANRPLDPRGLTFSGEELLIANAAEGSILRATIEDFAVRDCNANTVLDSCDLSAGTSRDCNGNHVPDECEIADGLAPDCNGNIVIDACDIDSLTSTDCTVNGIPDECELDCDGNGTADSCDLANGPHVDENGNGIPDICDPPPILFVDIAAVGADTGLTWADAFRDLQDALAWAATSQVVDEIWVAQGTYRPDLMTGDRGASFRLVTGTAIYGGFVGGEVSREQREPATHQTILSGDLDGDDIPTGDLSDNSFHVITGDHGLNSATLDGFSIVGGNADATSPTDSLSGQGGGLLLREATATIANCRFERNRAIYSGAASFGVGGVGAFRSCTFHGNDGTAVYWFVGGVEFDNCLFEENEGWSTGALGVVSGSATVMKCVFRRNVSTNTLSEGGGGGALRSLGSHSTVSDSVFVHNESANEGGAVQISDLSASFSRCVFLANEAANRGGGLFAWGGTLNLDGCILFDNRDQDGSDESAQVDGSSYSTRNVDYSCVQGLTGLLGGTGNIGANPGFVNAAGLDGEIGTQDDNLRLLPDSSCINAGPPNVTWMPGEVDLGGHPRVQCGRVDMGAFEFGIGDYDCDRVLERSDWAGWSGCATGPGTAFARPGCEVFDADANDEIDLRDFATLQRELVWTD